MKLTYLLIVLERVNFCFYTKSFTINTTCKKKKKIEIYLYRFHQSCTNILEIGTGHELHL